MSLFIRPRRCATVATRHLSRLRCWSCNLWRSPFAVWPCRCQGRAGWHLWSIAIAVAIGHWPMRRMGWSGSSVDAIQARMKRLHRHPRPRLQQPPDPPDPLEPFGRTRQRRPACTPCAMRAPYIVHVLQFVCIYRTCGTGIAHFACVSIQPIYLCTMPHVPLACHYC